MRLLLPWLLLVLLLPGCSLAGSPSAVVPAPAPGDERCALTLTSACGHWSSPSPSRPLAGEGCLKGGMRGEGEGSLNRRHAALMTAGADSGTLYVANLRSSDVSVIALADGAEWARVPVAFNPHELAVAGDVLLVTNYRSGAVTRLSLPNLAGTPIALGGEPHGVAVVGSLVAVTLGRAGQVALLDLADGRVRATVPTGGEPHMAAAWGECVYVVDATGALLEIDPATPAEGRGPRPAGAAAVTRRVAVGAVPESLDISPDGAVIAVANARSGDVSLVDRERFVERARVLLPGSPVRVRYRPDGRLLAVSLANVGQVALLSQDGAVAALVPVGGGPDGLVFSPDGRLLYVALTRDNRVAVIDVAARRVVRTLPAGDGPSGLLLLP